MFHFRARPPHQNQQHTHHGSQKLVTHPLWLTKITDTPVDAACSCGAVLLVVWLHFYWHFPINQSYYEQQCQFWMKHKQPYAEAEVVSSSVKAESLKQQHRQCSWCRILPKNNQRASCEYCLRQATKAKKAPSHSPLKKVTKSHREPLRATSRKKASHYPRIVIDQGINSLRWTTAPQSRWKNVEAAQVKPQEHVQEANGGSRPWT